MDLATDAAPDPAGAARLPSAVLRRQLFTSVLPMGATPAETALLSFDPFVVVPHPCHTHSLAATTCLSYLLTGSDDGYVRSYDFWATVNGKNLLTSQQKSMANLGDGVNKAGVARGYWKNEYEVDEPVELAKTDKASKAANGSAGGANGGMFSWLASSAAPAKPTAPVETRRVRRVEPVYSMAIQSDGLWALQGSKNGAINLATVRHSPGHIAHVLTGGDQGHSKPVSALCVLPSETGFVSGSWDQSVKDWDLNTGQVVRTFVPHKSQISSINLRPVGQAPSVPSPIGHPPMQASGMSLSIGSDVLAQKEEAGSGAKGDDAKSPDDYGSLFGDEDEEGKEASSSTPAESASKRPPPPSLPPLPTKQEPKPVTSAPAARPKPVRAGLPALTPAEYKDYSEDVMLVASYDGEVALHDRRVHQSKVGKLETGEKTPPWCMSACWSSDGTQVIAGRRNFSLDVWDVRKSGRSGTTSTPSLLRNLRNPSVSREVSCVAAFPDGQHIACASYDTVRIWNTAKLWDEDTSMKKKSKSSGVPFRTIAGHHSGIVSSMRECRPCPASWTTY